MHWDGMKLIEAQVRSLSQDEWIMIDYEDLLLRPMDYVSILAKWFGLENGSGLRKGFSIVGVRSPERDIEEESWERIKKWDTENSDGEPVMEGLVLNVMHKWSLDATSIWNNPCVVVTPDNSSFA